jgi:hypothetical protein
MKTLTQISPDHERESAKHKSKLARGDKIYDEANKQRRRRGVEPDGMV